MSSIGRRFMRICFAFTLLNGVLYLALTDELIAADREKEAKKFTAALKSAKDPKTKIDALNELGKLSQLQKSLVGDAIPEIYKALDDKDAGVRAAAAYCLGLCDEPAETSIPALVKILKDDKEESAKIGAAKGLAAMGPAAKIAMKDLQAVGDAADKKGKLSRSVRDAMKAIRVSNK